jgi:hypothetical protein
VELDGVWSHAGLAVVDVEESHPSDYGSAVEMDKGGPDRTARSKEAASCVAHRPLLDGTRGTLAVNAWELEDHGASRVVWLRDHEVKVVIVF